MEVVVIPLVEETLVVVGPLVQKEIQEQQAQKELQEIQEEQVRQEIQEQQVQQAQLVQKAQQDQAALRDLRYLVIRI
jgi:Tfp pilus assembly protein PilO